MSLQSIADLIVHTKNVTPQGHVFTESFEQRTENPRVGKSIITAIKLNFEGSDLIGGLFLCLKVLCGRYYSCLFDLRIFWICPDFKKITSNE